MEGAGGCSAVVNWVVNDPVVAATTVDQFIFEFVAVDRQAEFARHAVAIEDQRLRRDLQRRGQFHVFEVTVEEAFDPLVDRSPIFRKQSVLFTKVLQQTAGKLSQHVVCVIIVGGNQTGGGQL